MWIVLDATIGTTTTQDIVAYYTSNHRLTIVLPLKLDNVWLSLSLEILDYATFAPIMQLKMSHNLCWNVPYI